MIVPLAAGVAALYGYFRYQKYKQAKELDTLLPPTPPAGYKPSAAVAKQVLGGVQSVQALAQSKPVLGNVLGAVQSVRTGPTEVPSSRIPSSAYGTSAPPGPTSDTAPPGFTATGSVEFKL